MKKRYIIPNIKVVLIETKQSLLTMSINDSETNKQFAPEFDYDTEF